jgi:hypothetical protein
MLIEDPSKHHAFHLTALREKCAKSPLKIIKLYTENNELIINSILSNEYYQKINTSSVSGGSSKPLASQTVAKTTKKQELTEEHFDKFEEIDDDPNQEIINRNNDKEILKELSKSKAKKFLA